MISIFGVLAIVFILFYIIKNFKNPNLGKDLYFFSIVALLVLDIGYFVKFGKITIEYNYLFSIINFAFAIYYFGVNRKKINIIIVIFLLLMFLSVLYPLVFNLKYESVTFNDSWDIYFNSNKTIEKVGFSYFSFGIFARIVIFILCFYVFCKTLDEEDIKKYSKKLYYISWVIVVISIIEFIITNFINAFTFRKIAFFIFGRSDSTFELQRMSFKGLFAPMAFMREPSSYVRTLFIFVINNLVVLENDSKNKNRIIANISILIILMLFSKSLSGYIYMCGILFIIINLIRNKKIKLGAIIFVPVIIFLIAFISQDRIIKIIQSFSYFNVEPNKLPQQSEIIRFYSINNNIKLFIKNFIFGCGLGTVYSYSSVVTLITNIGVVGVAVYLYTLNYISNIAVKKHFFSWMTFITIIITGLFTGHMSYITYLETFAYQIILLKWLDCLRKKESNNE